MALNKITIVEINRNPLNLLKAFNRVALQIIKIESQVLGYYTQTGQVHKAAQAY